MKDQLLDSPVVDFEPTNYAGFWMRFLAMILDTLVTYVATFFVTFILGLIVNAGSTMGTAVVGYLFGLAIPWLYYAFMESGTNQATLGKMALGLKVTDLEGQRISFGTATGRYFGKIISALILLIGYFMAGFTEKKQALHDMMAGTLVLKKN